MSTAPTGWQTPKTSWQSADVVLPSDFNRVEGNTYATEMGQRTVDPTQAPSGVVGTLGQFLDWFANMIRRIVGKTNWYDAPDITLTQVAGKFDASTGHKHSGAAGDAPKIPHTNVTTASSGTTGLRRITVSTASPSGGSDGDVWIKYG